MVAAVVLFVAALLPGCMGSGLDFADDVKVDRSISTGSIVEGSGPLSDGVTVKNAVSSADVTRLDLAPIPWANTSSGSAGVISNIQEESHDGQICRRFTTTRHSYEGIARFDGSACRLGNGEWYLTRFGPKS